MKALNLMIFSVACSFLATLVWAQEQQVANAGEVVRVPGVPSAMPRTLLHEWVSNLETAGIVNRTLPAPYRLAMPLMSINDSGTTLLATYASMPGTSGGKGLLLFIRIPLR